MQRDKQLQFYRDIAEMGGDECVEHLEIFSQAEVHEEAYMEGGTFMPLGAWTAKGFDGNAIETKSLPCDVREHPVLGRTFRVKLVSTSHTEKRTLCRESQMTGNLKKPRASLGRGANGAEPLAIEDGRSESSSSSSSSSSSDDKKKSKKSKKKSKGKKSSKDKKKSKKSKGKRSQVIHIFTLTKHIAANPINQVWSQERLSR